MKANGNRMEQAGGQIRLDHTNRFLSSTLVIVWMVLIVFTVVSHLFPVWMESIMSPGRQTEAMSFVENADMCFHRGQFQSAVALYERALTLEPEYGPAMINLGVTLLQLGQIEKAKRWLMNAESVTEINRGTLWYHLGICHQKSGAHEEALACFERALDREADNAPIHMEMSRSYAALKDPVNRLASLERAYRSFLDPLEDLAHMYHSLIASYRESDPEIYVMMQQKMTLGFEAADLEPYDLVTFYAMKRQESLGGAIQFEMGLVKAESGRYEEAIGHFEETVRYDPGNEAARTNIRKIREALQKMDSARRHGT